MSERYDEFDRALLRAGKKAAAPTARMRARALTAAATVGATAATTTKVAAASKLGALAKATKTILVAKWTVVAAVTTASVGTAVYVAETRTETRTETTEVAIAGPSASTSTRETPPAVETPPAAETAAAVEQEPEPEAPKPILSARPSVVAAPAKTADPLREELGLVEDARRALAAGEPARALRYVDEHQRRFPSGAFAVERDVMRIDALAAAGRKDEATAHARDFLARHPGSAQARRIAKMTETNP